MKPLPFADLLAWALGEYRTQGSIFGIPRSLFYEPKAAAPYTIPDLYGHFLATPIGPGAGPHTQLAQNIVCAWLVGARFIELKTVQVLDELTIPRPCIDMADEGYNVEWSQELKLEQSRQEYVKAWALIHILHHFLWGDGSPGVVFNMSVGYDLAGIQSPGVTRFLDGLTNAAADLSLIHDTLRRDFPRLAGVSIPPRIADNVTLSTMHGCPPEEIEKIARYLLVEKGLHTIVKLNPTLLGREEVLYILHERLGFREIDIPPAVFEHDLQYPQAVRLIRTMQAIARQHGRHFGIKLTNTLAMANHRGVLPGQEIYMSGRPLYPITMRLFHKLSQEFKGDLEVSYSAGVDALNLTRVLAAGARPVTVVSDLLRPGGYGRLRQYLENLEADMHRLGVASLEELARHRLDNLAQEAAACLDDPRYKKDYHPFGLPKTQAGLNLFDCIAAPCVAACPIQQDVPAYAWHIAHGAPHDALCSILAQNPLPNVTGYVCHHPCQTRCTRNNYDQPVAIRALKRFAAESGEREAAKQKSRKMEKTVSSPYQVAVVGAGPSGLAAAAILAQNGLAVTIFEAEDRPGGLLRLAIPPFRLPDAAVQADIDRILALGVRLETGRRIDDVRGLLNQGYAAVYVATGAPLGIPLNIPGEEGPGVYDALSFLRGVRAGKDSGPLGKVLVIGGGNSAVDAARTALRLGATAVTVVYRRTRQEMPAAREEIMAMLAEGVTLQELAAPVRVIRQDGRLIALECQRMELGEPEADGRRRPIPIPGSEFLLEADTIIAAIGQQPAMTIPKDDPRILAGGDAIRGPASVVEAIADGRQAAIAICRQLGIVPRTPEYPAPLLTAADMPALKWLRARKELSLALGSSSEQSPALYQVAEAALTEEAAQREAARCLQCAYLCDKCVEVCPNRANQAYTVDPITFLWSGPFAPKEGSIWNDRPATAQSFAVTQGRQIVHIHDLCNECGNCATFCVHQGKPYQDKPRIFLKRQDFAKEEANAFHLARLGQGWILRRRENGVEATITLNEEQAIYEDIGAKVILPLHSKGPIHITNIQWKQPPQNETPLRQAAEMFILLKGLTQSLGFLPWERE